MSQFAKIALLGALMLRPGVLDAQAKAWAEKLPHDFPGEFSDHWAGLIDDGTEALEATKDGERIGLVLFKLDAAFTPPEFVIQGAFSPVNGAQLTEHLLPQIEAIARARGCGTVRFHTMRAGLVAKAQSAGWRVSEVVMRKTL